MDINQLTAWVAGRLEAAEWFVGVDKGPTNAYIFIFLQVPEADMISANRLTTVANNGVHERGTWHFGGYAAVRGFADTLWPYLTPAAKRHFNDNIREYKRLKKALRHRE